eukprot:gnl/TRDRNA2_/TRDRNA2_43283_c0_seq1.p1 gnl/TRDRNA2_/TRDRNA2_43283_c0~~gnl/TRDRNA2_/TRDRNA2_43283_c0_seq1.p1  ORF type:complete len:535 (+),score=126.73 gnl/TRDRNA2_/TRDRNA2_43283_c0_seq1:122-1726(+)
MFGSSSPVLVMLLLMPLTGTASKSEDACTPSSPLDASSSQCLLQDRKAILSRVSKTNFEAVDDRSQKADMNRFVGSFETERPTYRQKLANFGDAQFSAEIVLGGQKLRGILDTGSFEVVVLSKKCTSCRKDTSGLFEGNLSSTYTAGHFTTQHTYGSGTVVDSDAYDDLSIGPLKIRNQSFWEVEKAMMPILQQASFEAIVGVGPPGSSMTMVKQELEQLEAMRDKMKKAGKEIPVNLKKVLEALREKQKAQKHMKGLVQNLNMQRFSVCIGDKQGSPGYFTWNEPSPSKHPKVFTPVPIVGKVHWGAKMQSVKIDGLNLGCGESCGAIIDSGTTLIAAPTMVLEGLRAQLTDPNLDCSDLSSLPDLKFKLGDVELSLPPKSYVGEFVGQVPQSIWDILHFKPPSKTKTVKRCVPLFMGMDKETQLGPLWILGLPFFRKYYTMFDLGEAPQASVLENESVLVQRMNEDGSESTEIENSEQKKIWVALSDDDCYAKGASDLIESASDRAGAAIEIDATKLRVPPWVDALGDYVHL